MKGNKGVMVGGKTEDQWQTEEDVRTLLRAEEIMKSRVRFSKAKAEVKRQAATMSRITKRK